MIQTRAELLVINTEDTLDLNGNFTLWSLNINPIYWTHVYTYYKFAQLSAKTPDDSQKMRTQTFNINTKDTLGNDGNFRLWSVITDDSLMYWEFIYINYAFSAYTTYKAKL